MYFVQILKTVVVISFFLTHSALFAKGNVAEGKKKAVTCVACHGAKGISNNPIWPNLAGQQEQYLIKQLKDFKSGKRKEPTMLPFIQGLTDQDINNLSAYFSSLSPCP